MHASRVESSRALLLLPHDFLRASQYDGLATVRYTRTHACAKISLHKKQNSVCKIYSTSKCGARDSQSQCMLFTCAHAMICIRRVLRAQLLLVIDDATRTHARRPPIELLRATFIKYKYKVYLQCRSRDRRCCTHARDAVISYTMHVQRRNA